MAPDFRDALDDAILDAFAEPLLDWRPGEDEATVRALARARVVFDPAVMRHVHLERGAIDAIRPGSLALDVIVAALREEAR